ncbi:hypothetical protein NO1_1691 [Candidatus Termititenax aidoneus]|uniref:Uncharacterized protein n=1 Tax=Termititenax aidoneus TaxID=2218524 RepID=A0A388TDH4_TERA1|nr:hypothetical protein NO1_1691 [Candidatus Termititenax aidoneus]
MGILILIGNIAKIIIAAAALVGALGVILTTMHKFFKVFDKLKNWLLGDILQRLDNIEMRQLKSTICDLDLPTEERLLAGEEYLRRDGNGVIKARFEALKQGYIEDAKKLRVRRGAKPKKGK